MDSYIVRIYRRHETRQHGVIGLVEMVGNDEKRLFHNLNELTAILAETPSNASQSASDKHVLKYTSRLKEKSKRFHNP